MHSQMVELRAVRVPGLGLLKQYGDWRDDNREWFGNLLAVAQLDFC